MAWLGLTTGHLGRRAGENDLDTIAAAKKGCMCSQTVVYCTGYIYIYIYIYISIILYNDNNIIYITYIYIYIHINNIIYIYISMYM